MRSACSRCGRPQGSRLLGADSELPSPFQTDDHQDCSQCRKETYEFDRVIPLWIYEGMVCDAVVAAKFGHQLALGHALGTRLARRVWEFTREDPPDEVVGMPSHWIRRMQRRGNGNQTIAAAVSGLLSSQCAEDSGGDVPLIYPLRTTRKIQKQAWLNDSERRKNVQGAFALSRGYGLRRRFLPGHDGPLDGRHVLLVDDVLTTGATANEVTRVLIQAGARRVTLAVLARAVWG
ncbi:DNA utilization protein GntX [Stieleria varia]|uniref:DNA utilization protein GntX n=2 Tax=Stieleria varia TaxID=2528005 RepID=A0A5C6B341_9BACT|nr:DNA utilization protein GntX [Stieleria varia]